MRTLIAALLLLGGVSACEPYYYTPGYGGPGVPDGPPPPPPPPPTNYAPRVSYAEAGVFWDDYAYDDVWYVEAWVDDPDGLYDVNEVWADVYDSYSGSSLPVESFELTPGDGPGHWQVLRSGYRTYLDPFYPGYRIEVIALDTLGAEDFVSVVPYTY